MTLFNPKAAMAKMTNKPCFANGSEWDWWMERNCERCKKNASGDSLNFHCAIQRDMFTQAMGYGNEEIRQDSYDATQKYYCPRFVEKGTPPKQRAKKEPKGQLTIFETMQP